METSKGHRSRALVAIRDPSEFPTATRIRTLDVDKRFTAIKGIPTGACPASPHTTSGRSIYIFDGQPAIDTSATNCLPSAQRLRSEDATVYRSPSILLVFTMSVCPSAHIQGNEWGGWNRLRKALIKNVYLNLYLMGKSIKGCCTAVPGRVLSLPALPFKDATC